jgi:hypothetical protein
MTGRGSLARPVALGSFSRDAAEEGGPGPHPNPPPCAGEGRGGGRVREATGS